MNEYRNASLILRACLYHQFGNFADLKRFVSYWQDFFDNRSYDINEFEDALDNALAWSGPDPNNYQELALWRLAREELTNVKSELKCLSFRSNLSSELEIEDRLRSVAKSISLHYQSLNIEVEDPKIFVVDEYPGPNSGKAAMAITMGKNDYIHFGVTPGIYFKRSMLRPWYSGLMLAHEYTHHILNRHDLAYFGGPLEEGVAELYGALYLSSKVWDIELAEKMFIYHRLYSERDKRLDLYLDYFRLAFSIYDHSGINGLEALLKGTRHTVKQAEVDLWLGNIFSSPQQNCDTSPFGVLVRRVALLFSQNAYCSPLARYVSKFVIAGRTVSDVASRAALPIQAVREGLFELSQSPRLVEIGSDCILHSDCERIVHPAQLRYRIPSDARAGKE